MWLTHCSCVGPQDKVGHPVPHHRRMMQVPVLNAHGIWIGSITCVDVHYSRKILVVYRIHRFLSEGNELCAGLYYRLKIVCWINVCVKYFEIVKKQQQQTDKNPGILWFDDLCADWLRDRLKFVFSPDIMLCGWLGSKHLVRKQVTLKICR